MTLLNNKYLSLSLFLSIHPFLFFPLSVQIKSYILILGLLTKNYKKNWIHNFSQVIGDMLDLKRDHYCSEQQSNFFP